MSVRVRRGALSKLRISCEHVFAIDRDPYAKRGRPETPSETAVLRTSVGEAVTRRHRELKQLLVDEAGGGCAVCG